MKKCFITSLIFFAFFCHPAFSMHNSSQDSLGLPGDNFNLASTLDVFQKCETLEEFEKQINSAELKLNNLDLNKDDKIDYIRVTDHMEGTAHAIVLQVSINEKESQDVAVIEVDKDKNGEIIMQIVGNKELYGKDFILEPVEADSKDKTSTPNPGYTGKKASDTLTSTNEKNLAINNSSNNNTTTIPTSATSATPATEPGHDSKPSVSPAKVVVALALLPIMGLLFAPVYIAYSSPYHYDYYPPYWSPWPPVYYHAYYAMYPPVYVHYHTTVVYRAPYAHAHYAPYSSTSVVVINNNKSGGYNNSYNRPAKNSPSTMPANKSASNKPSNTNTSNRPATNDNSGATPKTGDNRANSSNSVNSKPQTSQTKSQPSPSKPASSTRPQTSPHSSPGMQSRPSGGGGRRR